MCVCACVRDAPKGYISVKCFQTVTYCSIFLDASISILGSGYKCGKPTYN